MTTAVAAIDLGATSGRVMVGHVGPNTLAVRQVRRFSNGPVRTPDGLHWNLQGLFAEALDGLNSATRWDHKIRSIGIDSWAVDYALMRGGRTLGEPFHYRDERSARGVALVHADEPFARLFARNGLQFLPFNTLYQLAVDRESGVIAAADRMLLIPDLMAYYLTGAMVAESTNASTTGLLDVSTKEWDGELMDRLRLPRALFPSIVTPGHRIGAVLPYLAESTGLSAGTPVVAVGSHDTASAVVATPMTDPGGAYISCGTWGLVGVETERPVLTEAAREANFTNEGGVDGRTRFLHNVMGLWLLSESIRSWELDGERINLERLIAEAAASPIPAALFDANDASFMAPGDMPARIALWLTRRGLSVPGTRAGMTRCIIESLAQAFADAVRTASALSGQEVRRIHITGGGSLNGLLCQCIADRSLLPVVAGPVEATAIGNVLIQGRALNALSGSLESMRDLVSRTFRPTVFETKGK